MASRGLAPAQVGRRRPGTAISVVADGRHRPDLPKRRTDRSATVPVIVDLWASGGGPCKTLGPMIEKAGRHRGAVELAKVNVDENPAVARPSVQSIPAVFALRWPVVDQFIGAVPEAQITAFVQRLAPAPSEADTLGSRGTRPPCAGPGARAGPRRHRGPRLSSSTAGGGRGTGPAAAPRDRGRPGPGGRGPPARGRGRRLARDARDRGQVERAARAGAR